MWKKSPEDKAKALFKIENPGSGMGPVFDDEKVSLYAQDFFNIWQTAIECGDSQSAAEYAMVFYLETKVPIADVRDAMVALSREYAAVNQKYR